MYSKNCRDQIFPKKYRSYGTEVKYQFTRVIETIGNNLMTHYYYPTVGTVPVQCRSNSMTRKSPTIFSLNHGRISIDYFRFLEFLQENTAQFSYFSFLSFRVLLLLVLFDYFVLTSTILTGYTKK